jgi:hypothetical protein
MRSELKKNCISTLTTIWKSNIAQTSEKNKTKAMGSEGQQVAIDRTSKSEKRKTCPPQ